MRSILVACLLLTACCSAELSTGGASIVMAEVEPSGCRSLGTVREAEGGGLRAYVTNRELAKARLRKEAARLGGNSMVVIQEERGDTNTGAEHFTTGVPGLGSQNTRCTNCVMMMARVYNCAGQEPAAPVAAEPSQPVPVAAPPEVAPMAPPPWSPPRSWSPPPQVIIIIQPPMAPPPER